jgi:NAD(P)H-dependent FMN reductase
MPTAPKILAFAGSARRESFNRKLVQIAVEGAREAGAEVTLLELRDHPLPIYDGDLETADGLPAEARALKDLFLAHQGLIISAPEYNSSIAPLLKNVIDWVSRPAPGEGPLACFTGKAAVLMSASPGALGGLRGLGTVRSILGNIGVLLLPRQVAVPRSHEAFNPDGKLTDTAQQASVAKLGAELASLLQRLGT